MQIKLFAFQKNKHVMQTFKKQNHFRDCLLTFDDQDIWVGVSKEVCNRVVTSQLDQARR